MQYSQRKQIITTDYATLNQSSRPQSRLARVSPPKNKGVFSIKPIKFLQKSNERSDHKMESGRGSKLRILNQDLYSGNNCRQLSRENKTKLNLMIKSDEETVGKFNRFRVKKDAAMKASPCLRKPRLDDNMFNLKNPIDRQYSPKGCQTQKFQDARAFISSATMNSTSQQAVLLKSKKQQQTKMFKVRKQHFVNLKTNLEETFGRKDDLYTADGQSSMSRQQAAMPTKTISFQKVKAVSPPRFSPRVRTTANSPVKQISFKQFVTTKKFNNFFLNTSEECQDYKQEREAKIERTLLIQKQNKILNDMYKSGKNCHKNEIAFQQDDIILPVGQDQLDDIEVDLILKVKCPTHPNNECQHGKHNCTQYSSPSTHQVESLETMESSSPSTMDTNRENTQSPLAIEQKESHTDVMMRRWQKHIEKVLHKTDVEDAKKIHQDNGQPEYAQSNYLMLRQQEESHRIGNYFDMFTNEAYSNYLKTHNNSRIITRSQRSMAVYLMIELNLKRSYEIDTLFMAVNVMDRYLSKLGHWNFRP